ncbi:MAG TPA: MFS transporter [Myxococcota bacterium]|nr:MFS transporter [Myxococcota bacterium]HRY93363.1 MFS transporter [Myxococcota bacterium]HSA23218.1 MFS transporter [Myxococcota bacterium]
MNDRPRPLWTRDFGLLLAGALLQGVAFYLLLPALPLYVVGPLGRAEDSVGLAIAVFSITAMATRPAVGFLLDRFGRRAWQLGASAVFTLALLGHALLPGFGALVALRLLQGLGWGMVGVASATVAADLVPTARRGEGMSFYGTAMPLALSVGPMLGTLVVAGGRFRLLFLCAGALAVMAWALFACVRTPRMSDPAARYTWRTAFEPKTLPLFGYMLPLCVAYGGLISFAPLDSARVGLESAGGLFTAYALGAVGARLFTSRWYDRAGPGWPALGGTLLLALSWVGLGLAHEPLGALAASAGMGLGFGALMPAYQAMAMDLVPPGRRGAANATIFSAFDVGIALGALGFGLMVSHTGWRAGVYWLSAGLTALAGVVYLAWTGPHFRRNRLR